ncbi:MAG: hypothetical protein ACM3S2_01605 [Ignavibacteriales bacterium]
MSLKIKDLSKIILLIVPVLITSCNKKETPKPVVPVVTADSARKIDRRVAEEKIKSLLGSKSRLLEEGRFQDDSTYGVAAGLEVNDKSAWGIKFFYFKKSNNDLIKSYETPLLKGSLTQSLIKKIKINPIGHEMLYYDSQDYFLGSGGGEIFSYIIDFNAPKVYYAHFFTVPKKPTSLFMSSDTDVKEIREFFVRHFQKDYPELKIVSKDYDLEEIY